MPRYKIGIDMGGTFTDAFLIDDVGEVRVAKVHTRRDDLLGTTADILAALGDGLGLAVEEMLRGVSQFVLGTTLTSNLLVTFSGPPIGLITTRGHRDVLHVAGGAQGKIAGLADDDIRHSGRLDKPPPLASKEMVIEVDERVDYKGSVVTPLDEQQVRDAAAALSEAGAKSVAICFLWSFARPEHELRAAKIVANVAPDLDVSCSHRLVSRMGEYLRFSSAAINAYCGPVLREYLEQQTSWLRERGLRVEPLVMQAPGGVVPASVAADTSIYTVGSGPVAGVVGASELGAQQGDRNIICTDMGGTTFDVGLVRDAEPITTGTGVAVRYPFYGQIVDVSSIGSGGGSIAWVDQASSVLKVGPQSAGAHPGPACYGRGGVDPTVTDANVVLGFMNPERFLGGTMDLDVAAARRSLDAHVGDPLGLSTVEAAQSVYRITNGHMADFLRRKTIENGYDPRTFHLYAYGGAGPVHATAFARELRVGKVVVPLGDTAAVYSALGVLTSDVRHVFERTAPMLAPFHGMRLGQLFAELAEEAWRQLRADGVHEEAIELAYSVDMRYAGQIFEVEVPLEQPVSDDAGAEVLLDTFDRRYDELFGQGAGYREAGIELLMVRVVGIGRTEEVRVAAPEAADAGSDVAAACTGTREVHWESATLDTEVFDGRLIGPEASLEGPAVVELAHTSVVLHPGDRADWLEGGTIEIDVAGVESPENAREPTALGAIGGAS